ncbi:nitrate- and nitrite sensing domain-containing protein [Kitasatospora sp. NPDC056446]|uniref:sensor histidine kinase n=1 Tax=Kitasatospora sp. NPDC056446 TaxID=3345819 RepID=UPI0036A2F074
MPRRPAPHRPAASPKETALRARANRRPPTPKGPRRRPRLSLRTALLVLAVVPSLALVLLWAVTSGETVFDFQRQAAQGLLAQKAGQPSNIVYYNLQEERRLSAEALARPGSGTDQLRRQRQLTDDAVRQFQVLSGETADSAPDEVRTAVSEARQAMGKLAEQRAAVDRGSVDQQTVYAYYTDLIAVDLRLFTALSHVDTGEVTWISKTLVNAFWAKEMLAREDAILARGWPTGRLSAADYQAVQQAVGAQDHLLTVQVVPYIPDGEVGAWRDLMNSPAWQAKAAVEQQLTRPTAPEANGTVKLPAAQDQWRQALDQVNPALVKAIETRTSGIVEVGKGTIMGLLTRVVLTTVIGLITVIAVAVASWRLSRSLRRRIKELHTQAEEMRRTLPEVVERLGRGEQVDVEAETRTITDGPNSNGTDELARLGQALNLARSSALEAAVGQAEQHRGFERLLQRIARRTQLLIGRQLRKLDELERKHEDPEVLEGLFDLDHLTARLRRYEENLVIMAGGQPQRRWRKPVPLLDVLRAAQGEVQDYRRIMLDVEGHPWLSERAVGPVAHVLAELMENATTFSKPPTPVEVRAAMVGRGLAIEIEDRGLGMDPAQYDAANELMSRPPRTDVLARADDIRLGFYVIARLASLHGLKIDFRPSAFGGTRVVVLVPDELVIDGDAGLPDGAADAPAEPIPLVRRSRRAVRSAAEDALAQLPPGPPVAPVESFGQGHVGYVPQAAPVPLPEPLPLPEALPVQQALPVQEPPYRPDPVPEAFPPPAQSLPQPLPLPLPERSFPSAEQPFPEPPLPLPERAFSDQPLPTREQPFAQQPAPEGPLPVQPLPPVQPLLPAPAQDGFTSAQESFPSAQNGFTLAQDTFPPTQDAFPPAHPHPGPGTPRPEQPIEHSSPADPAPAQDTPAYPDIAYARITEAEAPYADEQYRPADHYRLAERRQTREYPTSVPYSPAETGQPPLPQRVRQASLAAELRVPPPTRPQWVERPAEEAAAPAADPFQQPAPRPVRRSGAAIGAFQRQSRAARAQDSGEYRLPGAPTPPVTLPAPAGPPAPAPDPSPWALPAADSRTTRTDDQS